MINKILHKPLKLAKTHDFCPSNQPELVVVFIHGIASDSTSFSKAIEYLGGTTSLKNIRFVAFDLLGSGKSPKSDKITYNFDAQLEALDSAIEDLKVDTPLILVGHSMGCLISVRYANLHKRKVNGLVLVSPPIYRPEDFKLPAFKLGMENFEKVIIQKNRALKDDKAFHDELKYIVMNQNNYKILAELNKPITIIFGLADQIIASYNIPGILKKNPNISVIETPTAHGISHDKYAKILEVLEKSLHETI
ncbi:MAG: alpha/beta hydrolase [Candidatus Saccharibacteria bacterium]|nr:alpha/beta hydrolase [Candidatus Saccharibacteria bacterium]